MLIKTKEFQEVCKGILEAVDESAEEKYKDTLDLQVKDGKILLSVTNRREYFVTASLTTDSDEELHAVISASLFLKLISKLTTETMDMSVVNNALVVKSNGNYKFPLIFDGEELLNLPKINIDEVTNEFEISNGVLQDILRYNSKELQKSGIKKPVQKMFYIDEQGCITFTSGACVTNFTLDTPVKLLLSEKLVKLFKLFTTETVSLTIGFTAIQDSLVQTRIKLKNADIELTAITNNDVSNMSSIPAGVIREVANKAYEHKVVFNKQEVLDALGRLSIFAKKDVVTLYTYLEITDSALTIYDTKKDNNEEVGLQSSDVEDAYTCILNTNDFRITLESLKEDFVTMKFGNHKSIVIDRPNIKNVLPECKAN